MAEQLQQLIGRCVHVRTGGTHVYGYGGLPTDFYGILVASDDAALHVELPNGETAYLPLHTVRRVAEMEAPPPDGDAGVLLRPVDGSALPLVRPMTAAGVDEDLLPRPAGLVARIVPKRFGRGRPHE